MMWGWADDVARLVGLEQVMGTETSIEIFRRMLGDIAGPSRNDGLALATGRAPETSASRTRSTE